MAFDPRNNSNGGNNGNGQYQGEKTQYWLNVGLNLEVPNPETGEVETVFVSLPKGIPVDALELQATTSTSKKFQDMVGTKNWLIEQIISVRDDLEPGQDVVLSDLQADLQVKRVAEGHVPMAGAGGNPLLAAAQARLKSAA